MPTVGWFLLALISASTKFVTQMRFEVPSLNLILTKIGDIIDSLSLIILIDSLSLTILSLTIQGICPKNVKLIQLLDIML